MLALSIALLSAAAAMPNYTLPPQRRARPVRCAGACARRYRLPATSDDGTAIKTRALAEDGAECNVTRARICRSKPHEWVRTTLGDD